MKKINTYENYLWSLPKFNLKMKLFILFLTVALFQIQANTYGQNTKISLDIKVAPLSKVIEKVESNTEFRFLYSSVKTDLTRLVTIKVKKKRINSVLRILFNNTDTAYQLIEKQIILTKILKKPKLPKIKTPDFDIIQQQVSGTVSDKNGKPLPGASIVEKGTSNGTQTDFDGNFSLDVSDENAVLVVSYIGFAAKEVSIGGKTSLDIILNEATSQLDAVSIVGSRGKPRTSFDSAVPVDNLKIAELTATGKGVLDQQLMFKVPSYNSTQQPISDASAHFNPADLRGLLPSRTLVLVNGKRKNASALVYSYVTPGRGEVGVDMKSIPSSALSNVEILRDGAAAQYGSDAIAGVINLVMKKASKPFVNTSYSTTTKGDGEQTQIEAGAGVNMNDKGYANFTFNYFNQKRSQRVGKVTSVKAEADYWEVKSPSDPKYKGGYTPDYITTFLEKHPAAGFQVGLPDITITNFSYNMGFTLQKESNTELYSFGILTNRSGSAPQFTRTKYWVSGFEKIYPGQDFFLAKMAPQIQDYTLSVGVKTTYNNWDVDLSSTLGRNRIDYYTNDSFNQSYGASSPSNFYNGAHQFSHVVNNLDIVRSFEDWGIENFTFAFGAENRTERFVTEEGDLPSYGDGTPENLHDRTGSESFGGFRPENVSNNYRNNFGVYSDITADISKTFLLGGALRYEDYSDFGSNVSWKVNTRLKTSNNKVSFRGSISNGFRAPALHQIYSSSRTTTLTENGIRDSGFLNNVDPALKALGIPRLTAETSLNLGGGMTWRVSKKVGLAIDVYQIKVDDRIVLTGQVVPVEDDPETPIDETDNPISKTINKTLEKANVGSIGFFLNAVDTKTTGLDIVFSYDNIDLGSGTLSGSVAANFSKTEVTDTNFPKFITDNKLGDALFSREDVSRMETWRPRQKIVATFNYKIGKFGTNITFLYYGGVTYKYKKKNESKNNDATYGGKWLTDLSFSYDFTDKISLVVGANNLLNVYPDTFADAYSSKEGHHPKDRNLDFVGRFKYPWQTTQFGIDGTRIFSRLSFKLN